MQQIVLIIHVLIAISLISLVLLQHGKGADVGAAFGSGASQTIFGSRGSGSFLFRITAGLALLFFATSIFLTHMAASGAPPASSLMDAVAPEKGVDVPSVAPEQAGAPVPAQTD